jgi:hypothetical protein
MAPRRDGSYMSAVPVGGETPDRALRASGGRHVDEVHGTIYKFCVIRIASSIKNPDYYAFSEVAGRVSGFDSGLLRPMIVGLLIELCLGNDAGSDIRIRGHKNDIGGDDEVLL